MREFRKHMQMIFQDPYSSLDPRKTVFDIVSEPLRINRIAAGKALEDRVRTVLELVRPRCALYEALSPRF